MIFALLVTGAASSSAATVKKSYKQEWEKEIGTNEEYLSKMLLQYKDQSYFVAGTQLKEEGMGGWYAKYSKTGKLLWKKTSNDGDYLFGFLRSTSDVELWSYSRDNIKVTSIDKNGKAKTLKNLPQDFTYSDMEQVIKTKDGGYLVVLSMGDQRKYIRLTSKLKQKWVKEYKYSDYATIHHSIEAKDGSFLLTGSLKNKVVLIKIDKNGKQKVYYPSKSKTNAAIEDGKHIKQTSKGEFIIIAEYKKDYQDPVNYVIHLNKNFTHKKTYVVKGTNHFIYDVADSKDGGFLITAGKGDYYYDSSVLKISATGSKLYEKRMVQFDPTYSTTQSQIIETKDGGALVTNTVFPDQDAASIYGNRHVLLTKFK